MGDRRAVTGLAFVLACAVLASACGSTVQVARQEQMQPAGSQDSMQDVQDGAGVFGETPVDEGLTLPGAPSPLPGGQPPARDDGTGSSRLPGGSAASPANAAPPAEGASGAEATRSSGRGFSATEIKIGVVMSRDAGAANRALGAAQGEHGNPRAYLQLAVDEVNRAGGIAGRRVVPVTYEIDEQGAQPFEAQYQAACAYWTQDEPVFAVVIPIANFVTDSLRACLDQRDVPLYQGGLSNADGETFRRFRSYVEPNTMHLGRLSRNLGRDLGAQGFFDQSAPTERLRLGVVRYDTPAYQRAFEQELKPALEAQGFTVADEVAVREPQSLGDVGDLGAQVGNAVLQFKARGVTHVIILEQSGVVAVLFMSQAEAQVYRPRYGLHSQNGGEILVANVPARQLRGALGIGHIPVMDVPVHSAPSSAGPQRCEDLMRRGGEEFPTLLARAIAFAMCDAFFLLQAVGETSPEPPRPLSFVDGLATLAEPPPSAVTHRMSFEGRRDGAAAYRRVAFDEGCGCFRYTSELLAAR